MANSYGYGPTRNLGPARLKDLNADNNATGNLSALTIALGAAVLTKDATLHGDLTTRDADIFDGFGAFLTGLGDLNDNYGVSSDPDAVVVQIGADLLATNSFSHAGIVAAYPNIFTSVADMKAGILAMFTDLSTWKSAYTGSMTTWAQLAAYPSAAPLAATPAAAGGTTATITAETTAFNSWVIALLTPGVGNVHIGTGDTAGTRVCAVAA